MGLIFNDCLVDDDFFICLKQKMQTRGRGQRTKISVDDGTEWNQANVEYTPAPAPAPAPARSATKTPAALKKLREIKLVKRVPMESNKIEKLRRNKSGANAPAKSGTKNKSGAKNKSVTANKPPMNHQLGSAKPRETSNEDQNLIVNNLRLTVNQSIPRISVLNKKKGGFAATTIPLSDLGYMGSVRSMAESVRGGLIAFSDTFAKRTGPVGEVFHPYFMIHEYVKYLRRFYIKYVEWEREQQILQKNITQTVVSILSSTVSNQAHEDITALNQYQKKVESFKEDPSKAQQNALTAVTKLMSTEISFTPANISQLDPTISLGRFRG